MPPNTGNPWKHRAHPIRHGKATILCVGTVIERDNGDTVLSDWGFDCRGVVPALYFTNDGVKVGGYSVDELREIIARSQSRSRCGRD